MMDEMLRVEIISGLSKLNKLKKLLSSLGISGMTVIQCMGCGVEKGMQEFEVEEKTEMELLPKWMIILYVKADCGRNCKILLPGEEHSCYTDR